MELQVYSSAFLRVSHMFFPLHCPTVSLPGEGGVSKEIANKEMSSAAGNPDSKLAVARDHVEKLVHNMKKR